ncbi:MAG: hypothetical protein BACD_02602 [Bacteroides rodentium]
MIPDRLSQSLFREITPATEKSPSNHYLCALIDMGAQKPNVREEIVKCLEAQLCPLITEPGYEAFTPLGAMLVVPSDDSIEGQHELIEQLAPYNSDVISAWITSVLPIEVLAAHLRQATFAFDEQGGKYLLRYYDPLITPAIYGRTPENWQAWFFGPVISWWFALPNEQTEQWHRLVGRQHMTTTDAPKLILTPELMQALTDDPLPYRLLLTLEKHCPEVFTHSCQGVRLAQIQTLLHEARQSGINDHDNLNDYVLINMRYPSLAQTGNPQWRWAIQQAMAGRGRLIQFFQPS